MVIEKVLGLTTEQARLGLIKNGLNVAINKNEKNPVLKFIKYFANPLVFVLLFAACISLFVGEQRNAIIILLIVCFSVALDYYQERKASLATEKIASRLAIFCRVMREGQEQKIKAKYLTIDDLVILSAGDIVPADGRVVSADDFFINQSVITGESLPVEKKINDELFAGTNVVSGYCQFVITAVGLNSQYGQIVAKMSAEKNATAFEMGIKKFGLLILKIVISISLLIFIINVFGHKGMADSLIFSIAIAVGVTPELLPMIISINLARGSGRMSRAGILVKRLDAIPDFGSLDVLCFDKTGTLTEDKISLVKFVDVVGQEDEIVLRTAYINSKLEAGLKNVLDDAIVGYKDFDLSAYKKIDEAPYDFVRRRSSVVYQKDGQLFLAAKGAAEELISVCASYYANGQVHKIDNKNQLLSVANDYSRQGYRVLAIAYKQVEKIKDNFTKDDENNLILAGFVAFYDPPKSDVKETIKLMSSHGVNIKILTGDSPLVTQKICQEVGFPVSGVISGDDIDIEELNDEQLLRLAKENTIFARFSPLQKQAIIESIKKSGQVVGYMGDGINDALSLKSADVGISVENAVDVAKEAADIILLRKELKVLLAGVIEGRRTFANTMKYLMMTLSSNFGNMFSMIGASLFLPFFPMLPSQILLNNFLYDISQTTIPADAVDHEYYKKPKHWDIKFIQRYMFIFGPVSSLFDFVAFFIFYKLFSINPSLFQTSWFLESFATQTFVIYIIRTRKIPFLQSRPSWPVVLSTLLMAGICVACVLPPFNYYFGFSNLPNFAWLIILAIVFVYLLFMEAIKQIFYRYQKIR
jgi:Mg2+-importing ATPase